MKIAGFQKLTLIDFPSKLAATVFTAGCNFRCPFCHNPELVLLTEKMDPQEEKVKEEEFFQFLKTRQNKLEGVCITGGEPTIQTNLLKFIKKIKNLGFAVKLDTNGTNPAMLQAAYKKKILDFVAMDIKNSPQNYSKATGIKFDLEKIRESIRLIQNSGINYEFRTTVVPSIHRKADLMAIGQWLKGSQKYALQTYRDNGKILDPALQKKTNYAIMNLEKIASLLKDDFQSVEVR